MSDKQIEQVDNIIAEKINEIMKARPGVFENAIEDTIESTTEELPEYGTSTEEVQSTVEAVVTSEDAIVDKELDKEESLSDIADDELSGLERVDPQPELVSPVAAETFRKIDELEKHVVELMSAVVELTKSHDSLCSNIQNTVMENLNTSKRGKKVKAVMYTEAQDDIYKKCLDIFKEKTGKTQRELTNGVNQLVSSMHGYTIGKPGGSTAAEHILSKVAKDHAKDNEKYLSIDSYLESVKDYVTFITKEEIVI